MFRCARITDLNFLLAHCHLSDDAHAGGFVRLWVEPVCIFEDSLIFWADVKHYRRVLAVCIMC